MNVMTKDIETHWATIGPILSIRNEQEYDLAVKRLDQLLDEIGTDERHPLYGLLDALGTLIHAYEKEYHPVPECSGADILRVLMEEHDLKESDLSEIGSQKVILEVLSGKRELNIQQIRALAKRFGVSPAVFI